jgi:2-hydroxy-6-oxonona-2,4-dienedioate hydrolase
MNSTALPNLESRDVKAGGLRLHYRAADRAAPADAPVIVLVHGAASSRYLTPVAEQLAAHCRVYAPDLPGFGKSDKPRWVLDVPGLADALAAWIEAMGLDRPALLGNSLGCQTIADLASRYPQRAGPVILQGPTTDPEARSVLRQWWRQKKNARHEPPSLQEVGKQDLKEIGWWRLFWTAHYAVTDRIEDKLPRVQSPALVVHGALDGFVSQRWAEEVARLLPRGRLVVAPGAPHTMNYSRPAELARLTLDFLAEHRPASEEAVSPAVAHHSPV